LRCGNFCGAVLWRDASSKAIELGTQDAVIGLECAIRTETRLSRAITRLFTDGTRYYVEDLGSATACSTRNSVSPGTLRHGDA
jgi:hypothetical protein